MVEEKEVEEVEEIVSILVEMKVSKGLMSQDIMSFASENIKVPNFKLDTSYEPVPLAPTPDVASDVEAKGEEIVLVRGTIDKKKIKDLESQSNVVKVWLDTEIQPFDETLELSLEPMGSCPIPPCDCSPGTPKGTITDVANYLGVNQIWASGIKGNGVVIGIVDGGITAQGRIPNGDIPNVIDGWPTDWGTIADWGKHGNMTATDALGMAPDAKIFDLRITSGTSGTISNAIQAYNWAIIKHKATGKPDILSNSWGIYQKAWDSDYATNPNHPFTRKVVEAISEGIIVLFAAGNCGGNPCKAPRCGSDVGSGKSIWGANGHPLVMTIAAVNVKEEYVGYSSVGPAALDKKKPDFCGVTHFKGYFNSDTGTSAATPIVAGVVALLKQAKPSLAPNEAKQVLAETAKDLGPPGWDYYTGHGVIQAKKAFDKLKGKESCNRYSELAKRYLNLYRESKKPVYRCYYYYYLARYCYCMWRETKEQKYICCYYYYLAEYYRCRYSITKNRRYLCYYYLYRGRYYCCLYSLKKDKRYLCLCIRYLMEYYKCMYNETKNRRYLIYYNRYMTYYKKYCTTLKQEFAIEETIPELSAEVSEEREIETPELEMQLEMLMEPELELEMGLEEELEVGMEELEECPECEEKFMEAEMLMEPELELEMGLEEELELLP